MGKMSSRVETTARKRSVSHPLARWSDDPRKAADSKWMPQTEDRNSALCVRPMSSSRLQYAGDDDD